MRAVRAVVVESLLIAVLGALFAFVANAVSPRGLRLNRDYFPGGKNFPALATTNTPARETPPVTPGASANPVDALVQRLARQGLHAAGRAEVIRWFQDPQREQGLIVFVDARAEAHYAAGHIPGAWQFNRYRPEDHLATVLPACLTAIKVVVYCTGGQCEDSEFAAIMLRDAGVPAANLFVYPGGMTDWTSARQPVEIRARLSGQLLPPRP